MVDDLTGKKLGRASGTFRTADVVGLDTMAHVIKTLQDNAGPRPTRSARQLRDAAGAGEADRAKGNLGQKTGAGFYKKVGATSCASTSPRATTWRRKADDRRAHPEKPPAERLKLLRDSKSHPQAQFLWAILRDSFHYAAVHLESIADCARDVDRPCAGASA